MKKLLIILSLLSAVMACKKVDQDDLSIGVYIPNAFRPDSPDGTVNSDANCLDGEPNCNKIFRVVISNPNNISYRISMNVYDSKGQNLYTGLDPTQGWDGTLHNLGKNFSPQGNYRYLIKITEPENNKSKVFEGSVALLR